MLAFSQREILRLAKNDVDRFRRPESQQADPIETTGSGTEVIADKPLTLVTKEQSLS